MQIANDMKEKKETTKKSTKTCNLCYLFMQLIENHSSFVL